jgi:hypothetical protein
MSYQLAIRVKPELRNHHLVTRTDWWWHDRFFATPEDAEGWIILHYEFLGQVCEFRITQYQCEHCQEPIPHDQEPVRFLPLVTERDERPLPGQCYCSEDCMLEDQEERRVARCEAREQIEMYGDDLDSWYR